jgi:hypothetical protein
MASTKKKRSSNSRKRAGAPAKKPVPRKRASAPAKKSVSRVRDELRAAKAALAQRIAELAVINSIQQGMAAKLDFQAVIDLVGDKLRRVFKGGAGGPVLGECGKGAVLTLTRH